MSLIVNEPNTPPWASRLVQRIQAQFGLLNTPTKPLPIPTYAAPTTLPPAKNWAPANGQTGLVWVISIPCLAASNGTNWLRTDTGAVIA